MLFIRLCCFFLSGVYRGCFQGPHARGFRIGLYDATGLEFISPNGTFVAYGLSKTAACKAFVSSGFMFTLHRWDIFPVS